MDLIKKISLITIILFAILIKLNAQSFYIFISGIDRGDKSIYYQNRTGWAVLTPFAFVSKRFSPDFGETWERAGMTGQNLRPYIQGNPNAIKNLNTYSALRIAGILQMVVVAPTILFVGINKSNKQPVTGPPYEDTGGAMPSYVAGFFGFLYGGAITYHLIAEPFFKNALESYYLDKKNSSILEKLKPNIGMTYNLILNKPMISLKWSL
jgi:hypothetical protein